MSENQRSSGEWVRQPAAGDVVLVAKAGEGATFPDYVIEALKRYEEEVRSQQGAQEAPSPELERWCVVNDVKCELEIV